MNDVLPKLIDAIEGGRPTAYCRLVETRGSTPQKAGAAMLVYADGSQVGTLGGGCVEAEVKRRAIGVLDSGQADVLTFQLDNDYGWDDGLICGGRMQVLVEPLSDDSARAYFTRLADSVARGGSCVEAIVFDAEKSGLRAPSGYLFDDEGRLLANCRGQLAGGRPPEMVLEHLPDMNRRPRASAVAGIAYLPTLSRCRLLIVGAGHVGLAVAQMATDLDFDVWVVDDRADYCNAERFPRAQHLAAGPIGQVLDEIEITPDTYCLIVTRGHNHDEEALAHLCDRGARYVGMIGSKRKIKLIFDDLIEQGVSPEVLARVYAPLGIEIGSQTVPEIAVSILAELVAHRNLGGAVPGRGPSVFSAETS